MPLDRGAGDIESPHYGRSSDTGVSSPDSVRRQLENILSSEVFLPSPQLCRFLRFIVEQEIGGKGGELKEYSLGVEVFRKGESFDPRLDNVVRSDARRLRHKLAEYYQSKGRQDPIEIALPKGSYRPVFHARVEAAPQVPAVTKQTRPRRAWIALGAVCAIAAAISWRFVWADKPSGPTVRPPAIAVLPLENLSADPEQEYFSEGITDALITDLAKIRGLRVISRTSVLRFKRTKVPLAEIANQLGVSYLVEGTVTRAGERVRVTAQLIAIPNERHLWAESFERAGMDILALQGEIAQAIATQVHVHVTPQEQARLVPRRVNPEAHDLYLRGRFEWESWEPERILKSVEYFKKAIEADPGFALAYSGLADAYSMLAINADSKDLAARSCAAAQKAVNLDPNLGQAHSTMAETCVDLFDWQRGEAELRRAIELSPGYSLAHAKLGMLFVNTGRLEEGIAQIRRAAELDPLSPIASSALGVALYQNRQYGQAIDQIQRTIEAHPNFWRMYLFLSLAQTAKGRHEEAVRVLEKPRQLVGSRPDIEVLVALAHSSTGDTRAAQRLLNEYSKLERVSPIIWGILYMLVGDKDHAFEWLNKAVDERSMYAEQIYVTPFYDSLRSDPRYTALLRKMNLVPAR